MPATDRRDKVPVFMKPAVYLEEVVDFQSIAPIHSKSQIVINAMKEHEGLRKMIKA